MNKIRQKTIKVVNIPLLFKNTLQVKSPEKKVVHSLSTRNLSAKNIKKTQFSSSNKKSTPYQNKIFKIDISKRGKQNLISHAQTKKKLSTSNKNLSKPRQSYKKYQMNNKTNTIKNPIQKNKDNNILIDSSKYQQIETTYRSHDKTDNAPQSIKDFEEEQSQPISQQSFQCKTPEIELTELKDRFIKKRSQVYKVLCKLDSKFQNFEKSVKNEKLLSEISMNSKSDIVKLVKQKGNLKNSNFQKLQSSEKINPIYVSSYQVKKKKSLSKGLLFQQ